jgi:CRP/FNR family transcriptional regulator, nitrogen fixation regulation protein
MQSLARAQDHALLLGRRSAVEKVAAFLVEWAGRSADPATAILAMTRQDIADYLGLTIETVSRTLSQLEREAMIGFASARHIRLKDPRALRALNS